MLLLINKRYWRIAGLRRHVSRNLSSSLIICRKLCDLWARPPSSGKSRQRNRPRSLYPTKKEVNMSKRSAGFSVSVLKHLSTTTSLHQPVWELCLIRGPWLPGPLRQSISVQGISMERDLLLFIIRSKKKVQLRALTLTREDSHSIKRKSGLFKKYSRKDMLLKD